MAFTESQQQAIDCDGNLLVVSGPGSGKTTVAVERALRILADPHRSLIMVTFTREGADEMARRIAAKCKAVGIPAFNKSRLFIGTFHSIAIDHIFRHKPRIKTLSPAQQSIYLRDAMGYEIAQDKERAEEVRHGFEYYMHSVDREGLELEDDVQKVIERYTSLLKQAQVTDLYAVMRGCALQVHKGKIPPLPYTDMLVDESQDTDDIQRHWIFAHTRSGIATTLVGDDDQSIYEWRHALGYAGMQLFMDEFNATRIELGRNFRSKSEVLSSAVRLVGHNHNRLQKNLSSARGPGGKIFAFGTTEDSATIELARTIADMPTIHAECAILARTNISLDAVEAMLTAYDVEYVRIGKSIWDNPAIQVYLVLLQTLVDENPSGLYATLSYMTICDDFKQMILSSMNGSAADLLKGEMPKEMITAARAQFPDEYESVREFVRACGYWKHQLSSTGSVNEVVLDAADWFASKAYNRKSKAILEYCGQLLARFKGSLSTRLAFINRAKQEKKTAPVKLMTMHASKGQEFGTVHIIDANADADASILPKDIEAERRLMYVAITRAKDNCLLWFTDSPHPTIVEANIDRVHEYSAMRARLA